MAVRILYNFDTWDAATITGSSEASTDLADDNVVNNAPGRVWRTTGNTSENIVFDLGSAQTITCFALFNFNLTSGATVTLQANASDSWGSPSYSQALTIATDSDSNVIKRLVYFPSTSTYQYWRLLIADASNTDGYIEIGRIVAGQYYEPSRNIIDGFSITPDDPSDVADVGGVYTEANELTKFRTAVVSFAEIDRTQREKFETIFDKVGRTKPMVWALNPSDYPTKDSLYCRFKTPMALANQILERYNAVRLVLGEIVR